MYACEGGRGGCIVVWGRWYMTLFSGSFSPSSVVVSLIQGKKRKGYVSFIAALHTVSVIVSCKGIFIYFCLP